jgi:hypothetical protein
MPCGHPRTPTTTRQRLEGKRSAHGLCTDAEGPDAAGPQVKGELTVDCKFVAFPPFARRPGAAQEASTPLRGRGR